MRAFIAIALAGLLAVAGPSSAQMTLTGAGGTKKASAPAGYTGPGDIRPGALAWWGLRCYAAAYSGNVVDVADAATGNTTGTRLQCSSGTVSALVSGSACTFVTGNSCSSLATTCAVACRIVTAYDQSGALSCTAAACDLTQSSNSFRPTLTFNCVGSTNSCITFNGAPSELLTANSFTSSSQPFTMSEVVERTSNFTTQMGVIEDLNCNGTFFTSSANTVGMFAQGSVVSAPATDSAFHAGQFVFNGASSSIDVDGSTTSPGNPGTTAIGGAVLTMGFSCGFFAGNLTEGGIWAGDKSATNAAMNSNQHSFWGF